jgi:hypothetical protein
MEMFLGDWEGVLEFLSVVVLGHVNLQRVGLGVVIRSRVECVV